MLYPPTWSDAVSLLSFQYTSANFVFEVLQGSARVLNIKKTRKTRGGAYNQMNIFVSE